MNMSEEVQTVLPSGEVCVSFVKETRRKSEVVGDSLQRLAPGTLR